MSNVHWTSEFTNDQERQIEAVYGAVQALLDTLLVLPEYLEGSGLKGLDDEEKFPVTCSEIADLVADYLVEHTDCRVFFPTHVESHDDGDIHVEFVSDTY